MEQQSGQELEDVNTRIVKTEKHHRGGDKEGGGDQPCDKRRFLRALVLPIHAEPQPYTELTKTNIDVTRIPVSSNRGLYRELPRKRFFMEPDAWGISPQQSRRMRAVVAIRRQRTRVLPNSFKLRLAGMPCKRKRATEFKLMRWGRSRQRPSVDPKTTHDPGKMAEC